MSRSMVRAAMARRHSHYFKDVTDLDEIDVYMVCEVFQVEDASGATQHAIKKLLLPGQRGGGKDRLRDLKEARDTLDRRIEILVRYTGDGTIERKSLDVEKGNQNVAFCKSLAYRLLKPAHDLIGSFSRSKCHAGTSSELRASSR